MDQIVPIVFIEFLFIDVKLSAMESPTLEKFLELSETTTGEEITLTTQTARGLSILMHPQIQFLYDSTVLILKEVMTL